MNLLRSIVAFFRSLSAYLGVSFWVLIFGPLGMVLAIIFRWPSVLYTLGRGGVSLGLMASGIRYRVTGTEYIQKNQGAMYMVNHASNLEPPIVYMALKSIHPMLKILYKAELRRVFPVLKNAFDLVGFVPIQRNNRNQSSMAIDRVSLSLSKGASFIVFPEGTRSSSGKLLPFKKGGFLMAIKGQARIVPVAIQGAAAAMRKGSPIIWPVTVSVRIGAPIDTEGLTTGDRNQLSARARESIQQLLSMGPL